MGPRVLINGIWYKLELPIHELQLRVQDVKLDCRVASKHQPNLVEPELGSDVFGTHNAISARSP